METGKVGGDVPDYLSIFSNIRYMRLFVLCRSEFTSGKVLSITFSFSLFVFSF